MPLPTDTLPRAGRTAFPATPDPHPADVPTLDPPTPEAWQQLRTLRPKARTPPSPAKSYPQAGAAILP